MTALPVSAADRERDTRMRLWWDQQAAGRDRWIRRNRYYYDELARFLAAMIPDDASVLEAGCGMGYLLDRIPARDRKGVDFSSRLIERARQHYPGLTFVCADIQREPLGGPYDYLVLSDVVNELTDVWQALRNLRSACHPKSRLVLTYFNPLWHPLFKMGEHLKRHMPHQQQNWFSPEDIRQLVELGNYEVVREGGGFLVPIRIPGVSTWVNRYLSHVPFFRRLCAIRFTVARPTAVEFPKNSLSCSVIVPCLNEKGNIRSILERIPVMGQWTEVLFVDGGSTDGTWELLQELSRTYNGPLRLRYQKQQGQKGKGQAVREGFEAAGGDVLMILDADITVQPEDLPKFFLAIAEGHADFVNGSRLVYPRQEKSMRFLNTLANYFFGKFLSGIINHRLMDTLCGTKALTRESYQAIQTHRRFFGDFDPFGDFDLIFGASRLNFKIVEIPIRYQARTYGATKIRRFHHGWLLMKMCLYALKKFR